MIKVLVIDDSALVRNILTKGLDMDPLIEVVGTAADVYIARDKIVFLKPDVITLDVEMPKMDGLEFLKRLMPQYPVPVVMVSSMTGPDARITLEALEYGAVDFVLKPSAQIGAQLNEMIDELRRKVRAAAQVDVSQWKDKVVVPSPVKQTSHVLVGTTDKVVAIGASTGGTVAIRKIVQQLPPDIPGMVIVQHMPPGFTKMFADKLNENSHLEIKEAEDGDRIYTGRILIAPGGKQMEVVRSGGMYRVKCYEGEKVNGHCPSVGVLFNSLACHVGSNCIGIMLTGMGRDGADAMLEMRKAGARTIAQDKKTSVVFGMPNEAYKCGGAEKLVPLYNIPQEMITLIKEMK